MLTVDNTLVPADLDHVSGCNDGDARDGAQVEEVFIPGDKVVGTSNYGMRDQVVVVAIAADLGYRLCYRIQRFGQMEDRIDQFVDLATRDSVSKMGASGDGVSHLVGNLLCKEKDERSFRCCA